MVKISEGASRATPTQPVDRTPEEDRSKDAPTPASSSKPESSSEPASAPVVTATVETARQARERSRRDVGVQQQRALLERKLDAPASAEEFPPARPKSPYSRAFRLDAPSFGELRSSGNPPVAAAATAELAYKNYLPHVSTAAVPPPAQEKFHPNADGTFTFLGTTGADAYVVKGDGAGGLSVEDGSGTVLDTLAAADAAGARIWSGGGDDNVTIDASVTTPLDVHLGPGQDVLDGSAAGAALTVAGGGHDDTITGSRFADRILGGSGTDTIDGRSGNDAIEGGLGDDVISGGFGNDQLLGGAGDDEIDGGRGHDLIMGNGGSDTLVGGRGSDAIYADAGDTVRTGYTDASGTDVADGEDDMVVAADGTAGAADLDADDVEVQYDPAAWATWLSDPARQGRVEVTGRDEFVEMAEADLGVMLGTTEGRDLLDNVVAGMSATDPLNIVEQDTVGGTYTDGTNTATAGMWADRYGDGSLRVPNPILNHEVVHARQDVNGDRAAGWSTWSAGGDASSSERQTTGLPYTRPTIGGAVVEPANAYDSTDNQYRAELGLQERQTYGSEPAGVDPDGWSLFDPTP